MRFPALRPTSPGVAEPSSLASASTSKGDPDASLIARIANGEHTAYALFVERHLNRLLAFVERTLGNREDAEEVVQEAFLRIWTHASRWQDRGSQVSTWLHQIALNLCRDRWRRQHGDAVDLDDGIRSETAGPEQSALERDQAQRVHAALQALPQRQRVAVVLAHFQGMSNPETAAILECSVEAVESLLGRARRTLRSTLLEDHPAGKEST